MHQSCCRCVLRPSRSSSSSQRSQVWRTERPSFAATRLERTSANHACIAQAAHAYRSVPADDASHSLRPWGYSGSNTSTWHLNTERFDSGRPNPVSWSDGRGYAVSEYRMWPFRRPTGHTSWSARSGSARSCTEGYARRPRDPLGDVDRRRDHASRSSAWSVVGYAKLYAMLRFKAPEAHCIQWTMDSSACGSNVSDGIRTRFSWSAGIGARRGLKSCETWL